MKKLTRFKTVMWGLAVIFVGVAGYLMYKPESQVFEFIEVKRGDVVEKVNVTGSVEPQITVKLGFETGGTVENIYVKVGDKVSQGRALAKLSTDAIAAEIRQAKERLAAEEAALKKLLAGTKREEIEVQQVKVDNARRTLDDKKKSTVNTIYNAFLKADNAVRGKIDIFFDNPRSFSPVLNISSLDSQRKINVESSRVSIEHILNEWEEEVYTVSENDDLLATIERFKRDLIYIRGFLDELAIIVNTLPDSSSLDSATIATYKTDIKIARDNINSAISDVLQAATDIRTAESSVRLQESILALKRSAATEEEIAAQEAKAASARAYVDNLEAQIKKYTLFTPISGIVSRVEMDEGETVSPNEMVMEVISANEFDIVAYVAESDIAKIKVGDSAEVTFDAFGDDEVFAATLSEIDPAETVLEGVPTYKTTFKIVSGKNKIKSGMTANIEVITDVRKNVLFVPARVIYRENGASFVDVLSNENFVSKRAIETGLRGYDGRIEIVRGLAEGEKVVLSRK